jgi:hypothetical protein
MTTESVDSITGEIYPAELSPAEEAKLARCEADIEAGLLMAWRALRTIWQDRLYRSKYNSFEKYCQAKWGISHQRAHQLIDAANLVDYVSTSGLQENLIPNERTARAVLDIEPEKRLPVLMLAARASGGKLDSGWIKDAAEVHDEKLATGGFVDDGEGGMVEAERAVIDARAERAQRQRQHIKDSEDKRRKTVRLIEYTPFEMVDVNITRGMIYLHVPDEEVLRSFANLLRHHEAGLHLTVTQTQTDPYNHPFSLVDMAAGRD